jgi:hypothetical protein
MSTLAAARSATEVRGPARLLALTLPAYVGYVVLAVATLATKADASSAELTPSELTDLGVAWVALHVLWMTPPTLAAVALLLVARRLRLAVARPVAALTSVALVLAVAYLVPQLLAFGVETGTWGDSSLYATGVVLSLAVGWVGVLPATALVARGLARRGVSPKVCWTVTVATGVYLVLELFTYLSALGAATLAETTGPPPFLLGFLWAALGVRLLSRGTVHPRGGDGDRARPPA